MTVHISSTWPYVTAFAHEMERKLAANRVKGNREAWSRLKASALLALLDEEVRELRAAIATGESSHAILSECADVANFAMMVGDVAGRLAPASLAPESPDGIFTADDIERIRADHGDMLASAPRGLFARLLLTDAAHRAEIAQLRRSAR